MTKESITKKSSFFSNHTFITLCVLNFVMMLGQNMTNTLVPKYAESLGAAPTIIGMVASAFSISALLVKPISGPAIDTFNRKYILFGATCFIGISFLGYSISSNIVMLTISRLLHGCGLGFTVIACLTMVSDTMDKDEMASGIAYFSVAGAIAQAIAPGLGLFLLEEKGYHVTFLVGTVLIFLSACLSLTIKQNQKEHSRFSISLHNIYAKEALLPACIMLFLAAAYTNISSFLVLFASTIGVENIGLFFTVNASFLLVTRPMIGKASDHYGVNKTLPWAIICFAISMLLISISKNLTMFLISAIINAFGYGACQPLIQTLCMKSVPANRRGAASATSYYGTDIGYLIGPIIAGKLIENYNYEIMFRCMSLLLLFALVIVLLFRKKLMRIDKSAN